MVFPGGKATFPPGLMAFPLGRGNFPGGIIDLSGGETVFPAGKMVFPGRITISVHISAAAFISDYTKKRFRFIKAGGRAIPERI